MANNLREALEIVELRRYEVRPGERDTLIALFEREFIESQEACGMLPIGHYRDMDNPNQFVWMRGFHDMEERRLALEGFYLQSPVWLSNRDAANATLIDSDNVLLLRPAAPATGFNLAGIARPTVGEAPPITSHIAVGVLMLRSEASQELLDIVKSALLVKLSECGTVLGVFVSAKYPNTFPRLPVRDEYAIVIFGRCSETRGLEQWARQVQHEALPEELRKMALSSEVLRLEPAARSLLR